MPMRLVPVVDLLKLKMGNIEPVAITAVGAVESGGKWVLRSSDYGLELDPMKAHSVGMTNIVDATNTYPVDGDTSTAGTFVTTSSTTFVDADAGVDMGSTGKYLVIAKIGYLSSSTSNSVYVSVFGSADLSTWEQIMSATGNTTTEFIFRGARVVTRYRAFKVMHRSGSSAYTSSCRTYELSVYRLG